jgi:hypothetical protein
MHLNMFSNAGRLGDEDRGGAVDFRHNKSVLAAGFNADDYRRFFCLNYIER